MPYSKSRPLFSLLGEVYSLIQTFVDPFTYGKDWALRNLASGGVLHSDVRDDRTLSDAGMAEGMAFEVISLSV